MQKKILKKWKSLRALMIVSCLGLATVLFFIIFLQISPVYREGFTTLQELEEYGNTIDENRQSEGANTLFAEYTNYLQTTYSFSFVKTLKDWFYWVLFKLNLKKNPLWSGSFYKIMLEEITVAREKNNYPSKFIQKIEANQHQKFIAFGQLFGAFHSLTRYLFKLKELGIINDQFRLTSSNYYLIFLSGVNGSTPYSLEVESIILRLFKQNPNNIFCLRSSTTYPDLWLRLPYKDELIFKIGKGTSRKNKIPLKDLVTRYYQTFPSALYVIFPKRQDISEFFRFSAFRGYNNDNPQGLLLERLNESLFADFLQEKQKKLIDTFALNKQDKIIPKKLPPISLKATVSGAPFLDGLSTQFKGLNLFSLDKEIFSWELFSAPVPAAQKSTKYFHDSFCIISPAENIEDWIITHYYRDIRTKKDFSKTIQKIFITQEKSQSNNIKAPR